MASTNTNATRGALVLSNGSIYPGFMFGDTSKERAETLGEVVFQTGMVGYCESLTDPSYCKQILVLTYPLVGNYGVPAGANSSNLDENGLPIFESDRIWAAGLICSELSKNYSHWNAKQSLHDWMRENKTPGLQGIDTRKLTKELRQYGTLVGKLVNLEHIDKSHLDENSYLADVSYQLKENLQLRNYPQNLHLVDEVSPKVAKLTCPDKVEFPPRITLVDCGAKNNIEQCLLKRGVAVNRVPWNYDLVSNVNSYDGIMLSNGPGDPNKCQQLVDQLKTLYQDESFRKPIFGICLGHQLMGLAAGYKTYKLAYGNRGHNQPCRLIGSKRCLITSQNHGFALNMNDNVGQDALENWCELFVNQNDKSNEGIAHKTKPFFSVQFHPEHNAGPRDCEFLFDIFIKSVEISLESGPESDYHPISAIQAHLSQNQSPKPVGIRKVLVLGSGGLSIGQAGEFDYSGSQAIKALKSENIFTILINPNIATVQTSPTLVDRVYLLPVTSNYVTEVIKRERPDGLMLMFGGQTALNCGIELEDSGVLQEYNVQVLGPPISTIRNSEDRKLFNEMMAQIDVQVAPSCAIKSVDEALVKANQLGYPILVRAAYALGGLGSGFAEDERELKDLVSRALNHSDQILLDKSLKGWKEIEYEVVRDVYDNCATICNMENVDPLGIHTGESIVVAPSQTLNDSEYNELREVAIRIVRHLGVIGECNVQYAVNPKTTEFSVIEVNPRLSRSSALASKATGYPLAYIAAKLALGNSLTDLQNSVTSSKKQPTTACFEPSLDYCVVKIPRWDLSKFAGVTHEIGSSMKSVGEVMAIGRSFEEAFQKALRMVSDSVNGFDAYTKLTTRKAMESGLNVPTDKRIFVLAAAMEQNYSIEELYKLTAIDPWFLHKMKNIVNLRKEMALNKLSDSLDLNSESFGALLLRAKRMGFSDKQISTIVGGNELMIRKARCDYHQIMPFIKQVDTVAAEWPAQTNYLYLTYQADENDIALPEDQAGRRFKTRTYSLSQTCQSQSPSPNKNLQHSKQSRQLQQADKASAAAAAAAAVATAAANKQQHQFLSPNDDPMDSSYVDLASKPSEQVLVLGSGVYRIGSSVEFDCCAVGCVRELRRMGKQVLMLNYNPETVSTDFDECEKLYFDEISFEVVMDIYHLEQPLGIVLSMGGQIPNNIAMQLHNQKAPILGTSPECIDNAEDRFKFSRLLDMNKIGQPKWKNLTLVDDAKEFCQEVGYPCIVRPSYVLSGAAMNVAHSDKDLEIFLGQAIEVSKKHPVVVSKFIEEAKEIDIDGVAQRGKLICMAVSEHVENAGVHSGDATLVTPPQDLNKKTLTQIREICSKIASALEVNGPFNIQLIAKNDELEVIECNLRASRSFPFVSKTLNYDFIATATKVIMGEEVRPIDVAFGQLQPKSNFTSRANNVSQRVGVKVPQFSFSRLSGADIKLGVEMASTGEVACFGDNRFSAYLKALISTGFRVPEKKNVLISIGSWKQKKEFIPSVITLAQMGYKIYATQGTADYYNTKITQNGKNGNDYQNLQLYWIDWPFGEVGTKLTSDEEIDAIAAYLSAKEFDLVINLPMRSAGSRHVSTLGYRTRRFAVDHSVPLISDIKCAKLLIEALKLFEGKQPPVNDLDCLTSSNIITLPGLIDVHVHVREPGQTHKEDFTSCTKAALAGGVTFIGCMPNTIPPIVDRSSLKMVQEAARTKALCDYGIIIGANPTNAAEVASLTKTEPLLALKMYMNNTFGTLCMSNPSDWEQHFSLWPDNIPICVHAEGKTAAAAILFAQKYSKKIHICHISSAEEILLIKHAKSLGIPVTCEVAPHHLFLTSDKYNSQDSAVKPPLMSESDQRALWENLEYIDCFATDHAPHTWDEKVNGNHIAVPGFPGLETMLPLLLSIATNRNQHQQAASYMRLTIDKIVEMLYTNPKRIFNIPDQPDTSIEIDLSQEWKIGHDRPYFTKCQWSPFHGMTARGRVIKVTLRGNVAFVDDKLLAEPGSGRELMLLRDFSTIKQQQQKQQQELLAKSSQLSGGINSAASGASLLQHQQQAIIIDSDHHHHQKNEMTDSATEKLESVVIADQTLPAGAQLQPIANNYDTSLRNCSVLTIEMFDRAILHTLFNLAERYFMNDRNNRPIEQIMAGKVMATVFFEPSTRTEWSFAAAMMRLGGSEKKFDQQTSSTIKGESLKDTLRILASYCNLIILRHPERGAVQEAAHVSDKPVINAGDGTGEHPTQALLDVFTIRKEIGTVTNLIISMVGDLKNGRTVHSLAKLLCNYDVAELRFVSPPSLEIPREICEYLEERQVRYSTYSSLEEVVRDSDVIYMTRIQKERFKSPEEYEKCAGKLKITPILMAQAKDKMIVMHPLPRLDEISADFDDDNRAAYFRQAHYGLFVRMALITMISG